MNHGNDVVGKYVERLLGLTENGHHDAGKKTASQAGSPLDFLREYLVAGPLILDIDCLKEKEQRLMSEVYNTIEGGLDDLRAGKMILVTDDPDREMRGI